MMFLDAKSVCTLVDTGKSDIGHTHRPEYPQQPIDRDLTLSMIGDT